MQWNNFSCEGRIVKQSGIRAFANENSVCNFTIVTEGKNEKFFLNCSFFSGPKRVELLGGLKPGNPIILTGRLEPSTYNEKQQLKYTVYDFQLSQNNTKDGNISGNSNNNTCNNNGNSNNEPQEHEVGPTYKPTPKPIPTPLPSQPEYDPPISPPPDDDIPF